MINKVKNLILNYLIRFKTIPQTVCQDVPFFSQWESIDLVDDILAHKIKAKDDPNWKASGAKTKEEYEYWSWNLCGTTCLKMILAYQKKNVPKLMDLAQDITKYGGYIPRDNGTIDGLIYKPFIKYLVNEQRMRASVVIPLSLKRIKYELAQGNFVMVSVSGTIRNEKAPTPKSKTGHLALVVGYDEKQKTFFLNNPSGYYRKSQKDHQISYSDFLRFFSGRGIVIIG